MAEAVANAQAKSTGEAAPKSSRQRSRHHPRRERFVGIRLSQAEYQALAAAAGEAKLTPSSFAAEAVVSASLGEGYPEHLIFDRALNELTQTRTQVRRVGTNLNQAVAQLNRDAAARSGLKRLIPGGTPALPSGLLQAVAAAEQALDQVDEVSLHLGRILARRP